MTGPPDHAERSARPEAENAGKRGKRKEAARCAVQRAACGMNVERPWPALNGHAAGTQAAGRARCTKQSRVSRVPGY